MAKNRRWKEALTQLTNLAQSSRCGGLVVTSPSVGLAPLPRKKTEQNYKNDAVPLHPTRARIVLVEHVLRARTMYSQQVGS